MYIRDHQHHPASGFTRFCFYGLGLRLLPHVQRVLPCRLAEAFGPQPRQDRTAHGLLVPVQQIRSAAPDPVRSDRRILRLACLGPTREPRAGGHVQIPLPAFFRADRERSERGISYPGKRLEQYATIIHHARLHDSGGCMDERRGRMSLGKLLCGQVIEDDGVRGAIPEAKVVLEV